MRILIYGAGGIGGYFGAKLSKAGNEVIIYARGAHLKAIQASGIKVKSIHGDFNAKPKLATDDLTKVEQPDLIILGIKSWQIPAAAESLKPLLKKNTIVLPLQNGASNTEMLLKVLPEENVLAGLCFIVSYISAPGVITHTSHKANIILGEIDNAKSQRVLEIAEVFNKAEISNSIPEDITLEIWKKFLFIASISALGGLTRVPLGKMRESDYLKDIMIKTGKEIIAVANAKNIRLNSDHLDLVLETIANLNPQTTASTQRDIMEGKPSELENFNGYIVKEGNRLGVPTPVNKFIYECLLPMEKQARMQLESN
jgi:2-dehydropantoate 2-reductase